jgi:hypothetical protein
MHITKAYMNGRTMCLEFENGDLTQITPDFWPEQCDLDRFLAAANGGAITQCKIDETGLWVKVKKGELIEGLFVAGIARLIHK